MDLSAPYDYSPINERAGFHWPDGKTMAAYIGLNVEHFYMGRPAVSRTAVTSNLTFDPLNFGWRDYGTRVGFWRTLRLLDELDWKASVLINADALRNYPEIVQAGVDRDWAFLAHGRTNSDMWSNISLEDERERITQLTSELTLATGKRPIGWLGPAFTETPNTLRILAENGYKYSLDWNADDHPFNFNDQGANLVSVPYSIEINDLTAFIGQHLTPQEFTSMIVDQFEVMLEECSTRPGAVFAIGLHPFISGQPFRHKHLVDALHAIADREDVWYTTADQVCEWYLNQNV